MLFIYHGYSILALCMSLSSINGTLGYFEGLRLSQFYCIIKDFLGLLMTNFQQGLLFQNTEQKTVEMLLTMSSSAERAWWLNTPHHSPSDNNGKMSNQFVVLMNFIISSLQ